MTLEEVRKELLFKVLTFGGPELANREIDFCDGQKATVVDITDESPGPSDDETVFVLKMDFRQFEEHNKALAKPVYYDKNDLACLRFHETDWYPKDKIVEVYIGADRKTWPFMIAGEGEAVGKVVLEAEAWNRLVAEIGRDRLTELGISPL